MLVAAGWVVALGRSPPSSAGVLLHLARAPSFLTQPPKHAAAVLIQLGRSVGTSGKGDLPPGSGPAREATLAVPFHVSRPQADATFKDFHSRHWLQNPALPRWARPAKEAYVPYWVGDATVDVQLTSAEVGRDELVQSLDRRSGRYTTRYETVWRRVQLEGLGWQVRHAPEDPEMQLYASYKYPRADVEALRPGPLISTARPITADMMQVWRASVKGKVGGGGGKRLVIAPIHCSKPVQNDCDMKYHPAPTTTTRNRLVLVRSLTRAGWARSR